MCKNGGKTNTEIKNAITAADAKIQYDTYAKRLLAQKSILANILVKTVAEFKDMNPSEVANYIEGDPEIGIVPVELGLTNAERTNETGQRIVGFNTENAEINEGMIRFDIVFYVRIPSPDKEENKLSKVIVNIECQKDEILETYQWKGNLDLLNIVMIGITNELPEKDEKYELHRLICALLSNEIQKNQKFDILEKEYNIPVDTELREDVSVMCNLSLGIEERAEARGEARGEARAEKRNNEKVVMNMYKKGYTTEQIAEIVELGEEEIEDIIKNNNR